jgi:hypothetical protein
MPAAVSLLVCCAADYNTVESVLLACAVLVNLAGIMFESPLMALKSFRSQKDFIAYATILVIVFSIVYVRVFACDVAMWT